MTVAPLAVPLVAVEVGEEVALPVLPVEESPEVEVCESPVLAPA
jgi:hypothetical protein